MAKPITIEIIGDEKSFVKATDNVGKKAEELGSKVGKSFKPVSDAVEDVGAKVGDLGEKSSHGFGSIGNAADSLSGKLASLGKAAAIGFGFVGAGALGAGTMLYKLGSSFDDAYDKLRVNTGLTGDALDGLKEEFKAISANVPASFDDVSTALSSITQKLGLTGQPLEDLTTQFLNLSRITDTDLSTNISSVTRLFGDWSISTENQSGFLDQLFRASQKTGVSVNDLSTQLVQFGAPLRNLGFSIQESEAMLGLWSQTGVNTETVMAGLKAGVGKLAKAGENVPQTFKRVVSEIQKLGPGTEATKKAIELFGQRAGPDLADAITGGKFAFDDLMHSIVEGEDGINGAADDTADFAEKWQLLKNRVLIGLEPLATKVFGAVGTAMDKLSPIAGRLIGWFQLNGIPAITEFGEKLQDLWAKYGPQVTAFLKDLAENVLQKLIDAFFTAKDWGERLTAFFQAHHEALIPVAAFIGTILVAAFLSWAASAASAAIATIAATWPVLAIAAAIAALAALVIYAYEHWQWFHDTVDRVGRLLRDVVWPILKAFGGWIYDQLVPQIKSAVAAIVEWVPKFWKTFNDINSFIYWLIQKLWGIIQAIWDIGSKVYDAVTSPFDKAIKWVKDEWGKLVDKVTHPISIPNPIAAAGKAIGGLFGRAYGGPVGQGGAFNVGEFGRTETVYLPKGSRVERGSNSGGNVINVNVATNANAYAIGHELDWILKTSGR